MNVYPVTVHAPAPEGATEDLLDRVRAAIEAQGLGVLVLKFDETEEGNRWLHLESEVEAVSSYEARRVTGLDRFVEALRDAGLELERPQVDVSLGRDLHA